MGKRVAFGFVFTASIILLTGWWTLRAEPYEGDWVSKEGIHIAFHRGIMTWGQKRSSYHPVAGGVLIEEDGKEEVCYLRTSSDGEVLQLMDKHSIGLTLKRY